MMRFREAVLTSSMAVSALALVTVSTVVAMDSASPLPGAQASQFEKFAEGVAPIVLSIEALVVRGDATAVETSALAAEMADALSQELPADCYRDAWLAGWVLYGDLVHGESGDAPRWEDIVEGDLDLYLNHVVSAYVSCGVVDPTFGP